MTNFQIKCKDVSELKSVAEQILETYSSEKIFLLSGKMGAGKTTLIKEMCRAMNVVDVVNSPTFSIVNEYKTTSGKSVFHFDLYRIKSPIELLDLGYEEYLYSDSICLIEWPELATDLIPPDFVMITIEADELTNERVFSMQLNM